MARAKRTSLVRMIRAPRSAKPIVIRTTKLVKATRRHVTRKGGRDKLLSTDRVESAGAGFAVGVIEKMDFVKNLPSLPLIGKTGTIALGAYLLSDEARNKMADNICTAAAVVALYQLGSTGSIVGQDSVAGGWSGGL